MTEVIRSISNHPVFVVGHMRPGEGWHVASRHDASAREVHLRVRIEYDGSGYIVAVVSDDKSVYADDWFENFEEAVEMAAEEYGVLTWERS